MISTAWPEITRFLLGFPSSAEKGIYWRLAPLLCEPAPSVHVIVPVRHDGQGNQERDPERGRTAGKDQGLNPQEKNHRECRYQHASEIGEGGGVVQVLHGLRSGNKPAINMAPLPVAHM